MSGNRVDDNLLTNSFHDFKKHAGVDNLKIVDENVDINGDGFSSNCCNPPVPEDFVFIDECDENDDATEFSERSLDERLNESLKLKWMRAPCFIVSDEHVSNHLQSSMLLDSSKFSDQKNFSIINSSCNSEKEIIYSITKSKYEQMAKHFTRLAASFSEKSPLIGTDFCTRVNSDDSDDDEEDWKVAEDMKTELNLTKDDSLTSCQLGEFQMHSTPVKNNLKINKNGSMFGVEVADQLINEQLKIIMNGGDFEDEDAADDVNIEENYLETVWVCDRSPLHYPHCGIVLKKGMNDNGCSAFSHSMLSNIDECQFQWDQLVSFCYPP
ncbi:hypothetical protein HELRODRAFT_172953 [Helobdella robusta]|uniref:Uncharacterized protein n=1 Tax=Helobdella robusta TaxID=6412 RepID=T1F671_HELRO|nr:hypothetical protein HELRODRAFT_172953 [Helobdella robusta]ESO03924.1 hypothetical protein HELRODRAFT_172953 [Helobdella robusta]